MDSIGFVVVESLLKFNVLQHCDWKTRNNILSLNKKTNSIRPLFWRWACTRLAIENELYTPVIDTTSENFDWRELFFYLYPKRNIWHSGDDLSSNDRSSINVMIRFKPKDNTSNDMSPKSSRDSIIIPLHQRVSIMKAVNGNCSNTVALEKIMNPTGLNKVNDPWMNSIVSTDQKKSCNDTPNQTQKIVESNDINNNQELLLSIDSISNNVLTLCAGVGLRSFSFNKVFDSSVAQQDIYIHAGIRAVTDFMNGQNSSVIVYGQTGSGKTHTMFGDDNHTQKLMGLIPRACEEVFKAFMVKQSHGFEGHLALSYIEIFGNDITDLLRDGQRVGQNRVAGQGYVLDGDAEVPVSSLDEMFVLLEKGNNSKRHASTLMNDRSSRAHTIVILTLCQTYIPSQISISSRLYLADLGGSEQVKKSGANNAIKGAGLVGWAEYYASRQRLVEASNINTGLLALKKVIRALNQRRKQASTTSIMSKKVAHIHVPYKDSKLTMILSSALGGSSKATVVLCASSDTSDHQETVQTMRFGEQLSYIENKTEALDIRSSSAMAILVDLDRRIADLEAEIQRKEIWQSALSTRIDINPTTGEQTNEVWRSYKMLSADVERTQLSELLERRQLILGMPVVSPTKGV